jgi:branched-chain amino acid transport system substrate-binding protein
VQAQSSKAKVVALALAGNDLLNCIKQANEFGLMSGGQRVASLVLYEQDIRSLGLEATKGTLLANSFYWDLDDRTRAFSKRVMARTGGEPPNMGQAGAYASVKHYLKACASLGVDKAKASGRATVARMKRVTSVNVVEFGCRLRWP